MSEKPDDHIWVKCPNGHGSVTHQHFDYCGCCGDCGAVMVRATTPTASELVEALRLAEKHIVTLGGNPHSHDTTADQIQVAVLIAIRAALSNIGEA